MENKEALQYLVGLDKPEVIDVKVGQYTTKEVHLVTKPGVNVLQVHTLQGLVDYIKDDIDGMATIFAHINSPHDVRIYSKLDGDLHQRFEYLRAIFEDDFDPSNQEYSIEDFIVMLQSQFEVTDEREELQKLVSSITTDAKANTRDDGVSQSVVVNSGVTMNAEVTIKNPWMLQPFRTFPDIDQPVIPFVLRYSTRSTLRLHAADGGKWKLETIGRIHKFLTDKALGISIIS